MVILHTTYHIKQDWLFDATVPFDVISNIRRKIILSISDGNVAGTFVEKNAYISSCRIFALDSVSLPRFDNPRNVSDKPQTMSGFPSVPSGTASQTI